MNVLNASNLFNAPNMSNAVDAAFGTVLALSIGGAFVVLLLFLLKPAAEKFFSQTWRYRMCILAAAFFLLPVGMIGNGLAAMLPGPNEQLHRILPVSALLDAVAPLPGGGDAGVHMGARGFAPFPENNSDALALVDILPFLPYIWLAGAGLSAAAKGFRYFRFRRRLLGSCHPVGGERMDFLLEERKAALGISGKIPIFASDAINTPMLFGIFLPRLIFPVAEASRRELAVIFRHELIHYRRRDLWFKTAMLWMEAIHWFNPCVYFLSREMEKSCELSCDEQVVRDMSPEERRFYGQTILNMLGRAAGTREGACAAFAKGKEGMERRLILMLGFKKMSRKKAVAAVVTALLFVLAGCVGAASVSQAAGKDSSAAGTKQNGEQADLVSRAGMNADGIPSLPMVESLDKEDLEKGAAAAIKAFWGVDLSNFKVSSDGEQQREFARDELTVSFFSESDGFLYSATVDKETKRIVALDSLSQKADSAASTALKDEYRSAASALLDEKFGIWTPGEADCYLPAIKGKAVTDRTVYVFYPDVALYVELSLQDYHPVGYRFFRDAKGMEAFIKSQAEAL